VPELSLTAWLDPVLEYFARQAGIPVSDYSSQVGGEGIGTALEVVSDLFTKGWFNKLVQVAAGGMATAYAVWGRDVPMRLRKELLALGTHELLRFVDPKPSDLLELRESVDAFTSAVKRGDWNAALAAILRSPAEIRSMLAAMGVPVAAKAAPTPTPPTAKGVSGPVKAAGAGKGRYTVTG